MKKKKLHYCWFGGSELPSNAVRSLDSWKKYAKEFEIIRWDESNFNLDISPWTRAAYDAGKYAFVSDYVRFQVLYDFGGVYMDVGSELIREIDPLFEHMLPFSAIEETSLTVATGLVLAAPPHEALLKSVLDFYDRNTFHDEEKFLSRNTVNEVFTRELEKRGYSRRDCLQKIAGWTILPSTTFNPKYGLGGFRVTEDTYSVHRSSASWLDPKLQEKNRIQTFLAPYLGRRPAQIIGRILAEVRYEGLRKGAYHLAHVAMEVISRKVARWMRLN